MKEDRARKPLRLRDFIRVDDYFFSIVGYKNSGTAKCFLRYIPDENGDRILNGRKYRKIPHDEAIKTEVASKYLRNGIFHIPLENIDEVYKPEERLDFASKAEEVKKIVEFFKNIPKDKMGVTGSRLLGLESGDSDVDFVVYGKWWFRAREKLKKGIQTGELSEPDENTWDFIYRKRKIPLSYNVFLSQERRKYHRAFIGSTYFDLLYVRDYDELGKEIPEEIGKKMGKVEVRGLVKDDSFIFDYPAYYPITHPKVHGVLSFTHTYVGQAFRGERIIARGELEEIDGKLYVIVGTKREVTDEFIVSTDLIEKEGLMDEFEEWYREQA